MKEDHEKGYCHCCHRDTMVRWKNIYHMGSEGLWICQPCENKVVAFVSELSRDAYLAKKETFKKKRWYYEIQNTEKDGGRRSPA